MNLSAGSSYQKQSITRYLFVAPLSDNKVPFYRRHCFLLAGYIMKRWQSVRSFIVFTAACERDVAHNGVT